MGWLAGLVRKLDPAPFSTIANSTLAGGELGWRLLDSRGASFGWLYSVCYAYYGLMMEKTK
jgi:hypothetical protein